jgi:3-hydroxyisobutyrate dehydrogenase-like beta-hydroxyacid dehydrogenase
MGCGGSKTAKGVETPASSATNASKPAAAAAGAAAAAKAPAASKELNIVPVVPNANPVESVYTFGKELGSGAYSRVFLCKNKVWKCFYLLFS